ncbi:hypothetical protein GCM10020219_011460 [Nonomuraea dietziae]
MCSEHSTATEHERCLHNLVSSPQNDEREYRMIRLLVILLVIVIVVLVLMMIRMRPSPPKKQPPQQESPREILKRRYAAGKIDEDEYLRRMSGLGQDW